MNYKEFKEVVVSYLETTIPDPKTVTVEAVTKNNGVKYDGLMVRRGDVRQAPIIKLDKCYEAYQNGEALKNVLEGIKDACKKDSFARAGELFPSTFEAAKGRVFAKLINAAKNEDFLRDVPHKRFLDLAVVYALVTPMGYMTDAALVITNAIAERYGVDASALDAAAIKNSNGATLMSAKEMISHGIVEGASRPKNLLDERGRILFDGHDQYVLSEKRGYGASIMRNKDLLLSIAQRFGCGMYILPSSINEILLVPSDDGGESMDVYGGFVREVNNDKTKIDPENILSDHAYYFDPETGEITYDTDDAKKVAS